MKTYRNSSFSFLGGWFACTLFGEKILRSAQRHLSPPRVTTLRRVGFGSDSSGCERCRLASIGNNIGWPTRFRHPQKNHFLP